MFCGSTGPTVFPPPETDVPCCYGSALEGPSRCTCWRPVYDVDQLPLRGGTVDARTVPCRDCAYRPDSPENRDGESLPYGQHRTVFWCHQGMRRVVGWVHPDGRYAPAEPGCYDPPSAEGVHVPLKADGTPADLCAGWLAQRSLDVDTSEILRGEQ